VLGVVRIVVTHDRLLLEEHRRDEGAPIFYVSGLAVKRCWVIRRFCRRRSQSEDGLRTTKPLAMASMRLVALREICSRLEEKPVSTERRSGLRLWLASHELRLRSVAAAYRR
jgi:hypothetical protein